MAHDSIAPHPAPTIGRMVRFHETEGRIWPAVVHHVRHARLVDLTVFTSHGPEVYNLVTLDVDGKKPFSWHWPQF